MVDIIRSIEREQLRENIPNFRPGDTVRAHVRVVEGNRERVQVFEGVVISRRAGGLNENFTVRRISANGIGVERTFPLHSPRLDRIEVVRYGKVRRAKLYYLRGLTGRAARIKERRPKAGQGAAAMTRSARAQARPAEPEPTTPETVETPVEATETTE